jgi:CRISPR/Cas system-associated exonuclease Cas4 (RecB family)
VSTTHHELGGSRIQQTMLCPASVMMQRDFPNESSEAARRGSLRHEVAYHARTQGRPPEAYLDRMFEIDGVSMAVDRNVVHDTQVALAILADIERAFQPTDVLLEHPVQYAETIGVPNAGGTADAILINRDQNKLAVCDYKFGAYPVRAAKNPQLYGYAGGALESVCIPQGIQIDTVELHIIQPSRHGHDLYECDRDEVDQFMGAFKSAAELAYSEKPPFNPSELACRFCRAKDICPALNEGLSDDFDVIEPDADTLAKRYAEALVMSEAANRVRQEVYDQLAQGKPVTGYKLVAEYKPLEVWTDPTEVEDLMRRMRLTSDQMFRRKLASPKDVEVLFESGVIGRTQMRTLLRLAQPSLSKLIVVPQSDERPAVDARGDDLQ